MASLGGSFGSHWSETLSNELHRRYSMSELYGMTTSQYQSVLQGITQQLTGASSYGSHCMRCNSPYCSGCVGPVTTEKKEEPKKDIVIPKENETMMASIKKWYEKYSDILITVAVVFLADHFMFGGKFRHKIEGMFDSLLSKAQKKVDTHEG